MGIFDFLTLAIFAGLIVLFLQRSIEPPQHPDPLWHYLLASVGCAVANYLGNNGYAAAAILLIVATLAFIVYVLRVRPEPPAA